MILRTIFFFGLLILSSCVSKIIIPVENTTKADIAITASSKAVLFVDNNSNIESEQGQIHKYIGNEIYKIFGGATDRMFVGNTNAKTLKFTTTDGKNWFINTNKLKHPFAMIVFDNQKPFIEYNPKKYMQIVTSNFKNEINNTTPLPKKVTQKSKPKENFNSVIDSILNIKFNPDKKYAELIIQNSNNIYYPLPAFEEDVNQNGTYLTLSYLDQEKNKINDQTEITYKNNRRTKFKFQDQNNKIESTYHINNLGLLDSINTFLKNSEKQFTIFKYLPDGFIVISSGFNTYSKYLFNSKMQTIQESLHNYNNELISKKNIYHDELGRVIKEVNYKNNLLVARTDYIYPSSNSNEFKTLKHFDDKNELKYEMQRTYKNNSEIISSFKNGKQSSEIICSLNKLGEGEIISKNKDGNISLIEVINLIEK